MKHLIFNNRTNKFCFRTVKETRNCEAFASIDGIKTKLVFRSSVYQVLSDCGGFSTSEQFNNSELKMIETPAFKLVKLASAAGRKDFRLNK